MCLPVDKSIRVSAPQRADHTIFSTSSAMLEVTAELPILAFTLVRKLRPIIIGSASGWLILDGITARPRAISLRTNSGVTILGMLAPKLCPGCWLFTEAAIASGVNPLAGIIQLTDITTCFGSARHVFVFKSEGFMH